MGQAAGRFNFFYVLKGGLKLFLFYGLQVKSNSCEIGQDGVSGFAPFFDVVTFLASLECYHTEG